MKRSCPSVFQLEGEGEEGDKKSPTCFWDHVLPDLKPAEALKFRVTLVLKITLRLNKPSKIERELAHTVFFTLAFSLLAQFRYFLDDILPWLRIHLASVFAMWRTNFWHYIKHTAARIQNPVLKCRIIQTKH